jgi:hypothetical protein
MFMYWYTDRCATVFRRPASEVKGKEREMGTAAKIPHNAEVEVSLTVTDENGVTQVENKTIDGGPTPVSELKTELGVPVESALWVVQRSGKKKQLADHETHNVKDGDRFEALVRGGVS